MSAQQATDQNLIRRRGAVFIDLENLFGGRRNAFKEEKPGEAYGASQLTEDLQFFTEWMTAQFDGFVVGTRRAYANFTAGFVVIDPNTKQETGEKVLPHKELMEMGFEPISVFALAKGKNSLDMRVAADMISTCSGRAPVDRVLLVAGDSDYVPVIVDLRRTGTEVLVVGFKGTKGAAHTGKYLPKFADQFWFFEDLRQQEIIESASDKGEPHTSNYYRLILQDQTPRYFIVPVQDWDEITDTIFKDLYDTVAKPDDIVDFIRDLGAGSGDGSVSVPLVVKQLMDSGCFVETDPNEAANGLREWDRHVRLDPLMVSPEEMRMRAREMIVKTLRERLKGLGDTRDLEEEAVAGLLFGPKSSEDEIKLAKQLIKSK